MKYKIMLALSLVFLSVPSVSFAASLTTNQVNSIVFLLTAFGVDTSTIAIVETELLPQTIVQSPSDPVLFQQGPTLVSGVNDTNAQSTSTDQTMQTNPPQFAEAVQFAGPDGSGNWTTTWQSDIPATAEVYVSYQGYGDSAPWQLRKSFDESTSFSTTVLNAINAAWFYKIVLTANGTSTQQVGQVPRGQ